MLCRCCDGDGGDGDDDGGGGGGGDGGGGCMCDCLCNERVKDVIHVTCEGRLHAGVGDNKGALQNCIKCRVQSVN